MVGRRGRHALVQGQAGASRSRTCGSTSRTATAPAPGATTRRTAPAARRRTRCADRRTAAPRPSPASGSVASSRPTRRGASGPWRGSWRAGEAAPGRLRRHPPQGHLARPGRGDGTRRATSRGGAGARRRALFEIQVETPQSMLGPDGSALRPDDPGGGRPAHRAPLRHLRLHRRLRHRRRPAGARPPRRRPRQDGDAGGRGRHRRPALRRVHQPAAGRRPSRARRLEQPLRLVRRSLERGFYQGWDLHPAQLPTRYAATYAFFRDGFRRARRRLRDYVGSARTPRSSTSRRPRARSPTTSCAAWTAGPSSGRPRSSAATGLEPGTLIAAWRAARSRDGALSRGDRAGRQPVRQGREPRRPHRPRRTDATRSTTSTSRRSLRGDFAAAHVDGDQSAVLPTDTQKNTAFAYAKQHGVTSIEDYALALGRRLVEATPAATGAQVAVEEYAWDRIRRRRQPRPRVRPPGRRGPDPEVEVTRDGRHVESGLHRPGGAEVDRLGVQGLPHGRVHHPPRDRRPGPRHLAGRRAGGRRSRSTGTRRTTRSGALLRRSPRPTAGRCRRRCRRWAARARGAAGGRRDLVRRAQPAPLPGGLSAASRGSATTARCSSPPTGPTG